ncbi:hypothetical protein N656DRAFT_183065 [Canariomyces notabilis]|uniref:Uncharacterized protein n=1 Tax=Canariomyces notabilis TaxID=2074819 RepID=A0AAN6QNY6_9PEZI|nr:hypothetical protein N656DRAFT_183065 [Canariomyces arenarius]
MTILHYCTVYFGFKGQEFQHVRTGVEIAVHCLLMKQFLHAQAHSSVFLPAVSCGLLLPHHPALYHYHCLYYAGSNAQPDHLCDFPSSPTTAFPHHLAQTISVLAGLNRGARPGDKFQKVPLVARTPEANPFPWQPGLERPAKHISRAILGTFFLPLAQLSAISPI